MNDFTQQLERMNVADLIGRYVDAINHRDWVRYAECWTENGVFKQTVESVGDAPHDVVVTTDRPINLQAEGKDAVVRLVSNYDNFPWAFQMPAAGIVVNLVSDDEAQIRHVLHIRSNSLTMIGICYDRAVRESDGVWRLSMRDYRPSYFEKGEAPGLRCRILPDPNYLNLP